MSDIQFMRRALDLAKLGLGTVSPNPMVGCVIVHENKIIGEGYHQKYGEAHAEVNAVNAVSDHAMLSKSTAYVTLEPCAHHGRTPPCADLLVEKKVMKVVVACRDPFEKVDGKGIEKLQKGNVAVELGLLQKEAIELNKRFFTFHQKKRPFVVLKWAQTLDGFIARENGDSKWISNRYSRQLVHKWRTEEDAILVGKNTALHDSPSLTARDWKGRNPVRILLDGNRQVPSRQPLFNEEAHTIIFNLDKEDELASNRWIKVPAMRPEEILKKLHQMKIQSVIIEGGAKVLNSFVQSGCWDEARIFTSEQKFKNGFAAPRLDGHLISEDHIHEDRLTILKNNG